MNRILAAIAVFCFAGCVAPPHGADPASDAPEGARRAAPFIDAPAYDAALAAWKSPSDVNAWIGARFEYDMERAIQLSETQRQRGARMAITEPTAFFARPSGVCVDLARFGVETLRAIAPATEPRYLMIEFSPMEVRGNTLRRHWVVTFRQAGKVYVFADSKRPGHVAGPYETTQAFIDEYARYRGRAIVAFSERLTYERTMRSVAPAP